jgi:hypothetical protein
VVEIEETMKAGGKGKEEVLGERHSQVGHSKPYPSKDIKSEMLPTNVAAKRVLVICTGACPVGKE